MKPAHGSFWESADCIKTIALGANGVIIDSVLIYGILADQITKALPWFPIETLLQEGSKRANKLDVPQATYNLSNLMKAFQQEMMIATHALGKKRLMDISSSDLYTTDPLLNFWLNQ